MENSGENLDKKERYQQQLDDILSTNLTAENINTYSDDALNSLIDLIDEIKNDSAYRWDFSLNASTREQEDEMLQQVLEIDVGGALDSIIKIGDDIRYLDDIIKDRRQNKEQMTYIPSDKLGFSAIVANGGDFSRATIVPKTKVALFVLENDFGVDLDNTEEFQMTTGINTEGMMRQASYDIINLPTLNRAIASCDETGNITFIFDTSMLEERGVSLDTIKGMTKQEIQGLLASDSALGTSLRYSKNYPSNLAKMIESPTRELAKKIEDNPDEFSQGKQYLKEAVKAPNGWVTIRGFAKAYGIDKSTLAKHVKDSGLEPKEFKDAIGRRRSHYKEEDLKNLIGNFLNTEKAPDGWVTINGFAKTHGISQTALTNRIDEASNLEPKEFKDATGRVDLHYREEDLINLIRDLLNTEKAPDGWVTINGFEKAYGISYSALTKRINEASNLELKEFKDATGQVCSHYREEDLKNLIGDLLNTEKAPDGWVTIRGFAKAHRVEHPTLAKYVKDSGLEPKKFKGVTGRVDLHYREEDLKNLIGDLLNTEKAPDGWVTINGFAKAHGVSYFALTKCVKDSGLEPKKFKGATGRVDLHYREEDLNRILSEIKK